MRIFLFLLTIQIAFAYEMTIIKAVSNSKNTFVTTHGIEDGIFEGKEATFTKDNVSIIATAIKVSRNLTQWELANDNILPPFKAQDLVTYYDAKEYLWALTPERIKAKYIKSYLHKTTNALVISTSVIRGINESVSGTTPGDTTRGGLALDALFEQQIAKRLSYTLGIRYSRENIQDESSTIATQRFMGLVGAKYYFDPIEQLGGAKFGIEIALGYGQSRTEFISATSTGFASLIPSTKLGLHYPWDEQMELIFDLGYESLSINEKFEDQSEQTTNLDNGRFGFGIKKYF